jgi:electron transfer flavoprotein beta subunit
MKIAVCLKYVYDPATVEVDPISGAIDVRRLLYRLDPAGESALEPALRLSADGVLAITVGPPAADAVARAALAAGAGRAQRVWDDIRDETEPFATALLLAAALRAEEPPDLVLCGARSADRGSGQVPALLAEHLGWPAVVDVTGLQIEAGRALLQRRLDRGAREEVEVTLPAVLGLDPGLARLRHASLPGLMAAQRATIEARSPAELGLAPDATAAPAPLRSAVLPPRPRPRPIFTPDSAQPAYERIGQILAAGVSRKSGRVIAGPPEQLAAEALAFLRAHDLLDFRF